MDEKKMSAERGFEIGKDEAWFSNIKRTYDEYQNESLNSIRDQRAFVEKVRADTLAHTNTIHAITEQAMQNAVETANIVSKSVIETNNMIGKQMVRDQGFTLDRQWNIDEVSGLSAKSGVQADTIQAIVTAAVADALTKAGIASA